MTKSEIINNLIHESKLNKKEVSYIIDSFLKKIIESTKNNDHVEIRGFGTFYKGEKKARKIHSPIAGKTLDVPSKDILKFKASKITEREFNNIK